jgi:predicted dehydrogenase
MEGISLSAPFFIEAKRLSPTANRETDVNVIFDLMIHDIDLTLMLMKESPIEVSSFGLRDRNGNLEQVFAWLGFSGGRKAFLEASRIALKSQRSLRFLTLQQEFFLNLLENKRLSRDLASAESAHEKTFLIDALLEQDKSFINSVLQSHTHNFVMEAEKAQSIAERILAETDSHPNNNRKFEEARSVEI